MSYDDHLRRLQGSGYKKNIHPYAAIEHRIIDSIAFSRLKSSAVRLLLLLARQLTKDNNGHLQATWSFCRRKGFGGENTLREAIRELMAYGLIYRTRSRGANKVPALYALTWLPIKNSKSLYLDGFLKDAWKLWEEKNHPSKNDVLKPQFLSFGAQKPSNFDVNRPSKSDDYELMPCTSLVTKESECLLDPEHWL